MKNKIIEVQKIKVNITNIDDNDYICISDFTKFKEGKSTSDDIIRNWLRNRITLEFLETWESIYNPNFNSVEFDGFRKNAGLHTFTLSVTEWCEKTNAIGIYSKRGKYGGTYAHKDIAFEFASAISPVFKLYLIKEFERLKELENQNREWDVKRILTKNNIYAIKNYILPDNDYYKNKEWLKYAEEADILNVAIFNTTDKKWRELNPDLAKTSNVRDYATINELTVLSNLESHNAELIKEGKSKEERFEILNSIARYQLEVLNNSEKIKLLESKNNVLLIHGFNGIPKIFNYFKEELKNKGYNVILPNFPVREEIEIERYFEVFDKYKEIFNDNLIVIAHSIGNPMFIKYISKNNYKIGKYISLAGFSEAYYNEGKDDLNEKVKLTVLTDKEKEDAIRQINEKYSIYSDNDHIVPFDLLEKYCEDIESKPILIKNIGHMGNKSGLETLPEVIDLIDD